MLLPKAVSSASLLSYAPSTNNNNSPNNSNSNNNNNNLNYNNADASNNATASKMCNSCCKLIHTFLVFLFCFFLKFYIKLFVLYQFVTVCRKEKQ